MFFLCCFLWLSARRVGHQSPNFCLEFIYLSFELADPVGEAHDHLDARQVHPHVVGETPDLAHPLQVVERVQADTAFRSGRLDQARALAARARSAAAAAESASGRAREILAASGDSQRLLEEIQ